MFLGALSLFMTVSTAAMAATYAVPDNGQSANDCVTGYICLPENTQQTFSIGSMSFPPPWLQASNPAQRASLGILTVVQTPQPAGNFSSVSSSIQMVNGVPTVVWVTSPVSPVSTIADSARSMTISQAKALAAKGDTAGALNLLLQLQGN